MLSPKKILEQLKPKHWYSWRTSILLSAVSGVLSLAAKLLGTKPFSPVAWLIATCGWFFLITGISWAVKEQGSRFSAWITGAVLCFFSFGQLQNPDWGQAFVVWPVVSAAVFALPYFWDESLKKKLPKMEERIVILLIIGSQLMISFWIQFFIVLSNFIEEYPSFYSDNLSESLFIVRSPTSPAPDPRGVFVLDRLEETLQTYYSDRPWGVVKAELINNPVDPIRDNLAIVEGRIPDLKEDRAWQLRDPAIAAQAKGYQLTLQYEWQGSKARRDEDYYVEKICDLTPAPNTTEPQGEPMTAIACQASKVYGWLAGELD